MSRAPDLRNNKIINKKSGTGFTQSRSEIHHLLIAITTAAAFAMFATTAAATAAAVFTTTTAAASRTLFARTGDVNGQGAAIQLRTVHGGNGLLSFFF